MKNTQYMSKEEYDELTNIMPAGKQKDAILELESAGQMGFINRNQENEMQLVNLISIPTDYPEQIEPLYRPSKKLDVTELIGNSYEFSVYQGIDI